jgi:hypothetical protein
LDHIHLMAILASKLFICRSTSPKRLLLSSSLRHELRMLPVKDWARCTMMRVVNICLESLRHSASTMAWKGSTLSGIDLNRMVLQNKLIEQWKRVLSLCI